MDNGNITIEEYNILFENKKNWSDSNNKIIFFSNSLAKVIEFQKNTNYKEKKTAPFLNLGYSDQHITLDYISFPKFVLSNFFGFHIKHSISFQSATFFGEADFNQCIFEKGIFFHHVKFFKKTEFFMTIFKHNVYFNSEVYFYDTIRFFNTKFMNIATFDNAKFYKNSEFYNTSFENISSFKKIESLDELSFTDSVFLEKTNFENSTFKRLISFKNVTFKKEINFSNIRLGTLELSQTKFQEISFLGLLNIKYKVLNKKNFLNKESARIIKHHFEKQNNLSEANKYFVLEQDKYLDELIKDGIWRNRNNIFPIFLNKIISHHSTSWLRVLLWIIFFTLAIYYLQNGIPQNKIEWLKLPHEAIKLIDPLQMFKEEDSTHLKNKEFWKFSIRIIMFYLFWQFIISFRQSTKRK